MTCRQSGLSRYQRRWIYSSEQIPKPLLQCQSAHVGLVCPQHEYVLIQHRSSEFQNELRKKSRRERSRHLKKSVAELLARGQTISQRHIKSLGYMKPSDLRRPEIKKRIEWLQAKYGG